MDISEQSEILFIFWCLFVLIVTERTSQHLHPSSQFFILLFNLLKELSSACAHTSCVSQQAMIDFFFPSNCPWDHPAVFSQCSSHLLLEFAHDVTASCWVRSHFGLQPRMFWENVSVGSEFDSVSQIDFQSSYRPEHGAGHVCGCALWICSCPDGQNKLSKEHQHVLIALWQLYCSVTVLQLLKVSPDKLPEQDLRSLKISLRSNSINLFSF